ncbi:MAG: DUF5995 family protein, partial [Gaiellaceae bacterium]
MVATMRAIDETLPTADGVAWFNKLYLRVTESVEDSLGRGSAFRDPSFLPRLDVVFANLYFDALREASRGETGAPRAWLPLIESRARPDVAPLQFALAGMNAHINRDLPLALADTWTELRRRPKLGGPEHADFIRVNVLLAETEAQVKVWFADGFVGVVDRTFGNLDDVLAIWNVARARDAAWTNGEALLAIRGDPDLTSAFLL